MLREKQKLLEMLHKNFSVELQLETTAKTKKLSKLLLMIKVGLYRKKPLAMITKAG